MAVDLVGEELRHVVSRVVFDCKASGGRYGASRRRRRVSRRCRHHRDAIMPKATGSMGERCKFP